MSSLKDLYLAQIKDLYDAEHRLLEVLPRFAQKAVNAELREALESHLRETQTQAEKLERIFANHDVEPERETCKAMKGLIAEAEAELSEWTDPAVKDAALIASVQRIEHYEIAGYGTASCYAETLGFLDDVYLLEEILAEEKAADSKLNDLATDRVNQDAMLSGNDEDLEWRSPSL